MFSDDGAKEIVVMRSHSRYVVFIDLENHAE